MYYRRDRRKPSSDAWVIAPSNGFNGIGESDHARYGAGLGANVVLPKLLLGGKAADTQTDFARLLRDNYETSVHLPTGPQRVADNERLLSLMRLSLRDFVAHAHTVASPDELSLFLARHLMHELAPSLLWVTLHDIDVAHSGAFSLYTDAITRSDRICAAPVPARCCCVTLHAKSTAP